MGNPLGRKGLNKIKWYQFLTFQLWLSNFVQGAIFLVFTHMMTWPCWCTKQRQNVAKVLHNNRITFPKDLFRYCSVHQHGSGDVTWKTRIQNMHVKIMHYEWTVILKNLRSPHSPYCDTDWLYPQMAQAGEEDWMEQTLSLLTTHHLANVLLQFSYHLTVPGKHCHIINFIFNFPCTCIIMTT